MGYVAHFGNFLKDNTPKIPVQWIYQSINFVLDLTAASQIALNKFDPAELKLHVLHSITDKHF